SQRQLSADGHVVAKSLKCGRFWRVSVGIVNLLVELDNGPLPYDSSSSGTRLILFRTLQIRGSFYDGFIASANLIRPRG
ncbi:MAG: hypothetical protein KDB03_29010, partial [Planctomycetales bacterium]|nr:hypothetical protein [Planctomycetales bacterium]